jgi:hypothetical protein
MASALLALLQSIQGKSKGKLPADFNINASLIYSLDVSSSHLDQVLDVYEPVSSTASMVVQSAFCDGFNLVLALLIDDVHSRHNISGQQGSQALERSLAAVGRLGEGTESFRMKRASLLIDCTKVLAHLDIENRGNLVDEARQIAKRWSSTERAVPVKALLDSLL